MLSEALKAVEDVTIWPIIGLLLCVALFVGVVVWAIRLDRRHIEHMSRLPLEPDPASHARENEHHG